MNAIIVDDEQKARQTLSILLGEFCPEVNIQTTCEDVPSAVKAIYAHNPELVFLDIEMPNFNGFQLLDLVPDKSFQVIFVTGYQEYAIKAFQVSAVDYLLKPVQPELLVKAVSKARELSTLQTRQEKLSTLRHNWQQEHIARVALPVTDGLIFVDVKDIILIEADGAYVRIKLVNQSDIMVSKGLKYFEEILTQPFFFRTHRSFLINLNFVKRYVRQDGGYIVMADGSEVAISKERREEFLKVSRLQE